MPLSWRRRSQRLYKTVSSTSSSDNESYTSDSSSSEGFSQQSKPNPHSTFTASASTIPSNHGIDRSQDMILPNSAPCFSVASNPATDLSLQEDSLQETIKIQMLSDFGQDSSDYDSDYYCYDHAHAVRESQRREGRNTPILQWEIISMQYERWFKMMEMRGPEPATEDPTPSEPSPDITLPLLRYQKEWLTWGLNQEASVVRGGILADEMGMGKTIQAISLVVTARSLPSHSEASCSSSKGSNKCTLVICPLVAVMQWQKEIEKCTIDGSNKVFVFHGPKRPRGEVDFSRYDFVLTTYSTVETDYRKFVMLAKAICSLCDRNFSSTRALNSHVRRECGSFAYLMSEKKKMKITTPTDPSASCGKSALHSTRWERIMLDEIRFVQIFPYAYYFCKDCDCCKLDYICTRCPQCMHENTRHFSWWNKHIASSIKNFDNGKDRQRALLLLREKFLKSIMLRRTKSDRATDFSYPPKFMTLRQDTMDEREQEFFQALYTQSRTQFNAYVEAGTLMKNYAHVFDMAVNHPYLVMYPSRPESCGLCHSKADDSVTTACKHTFCKTCWDSYLDIVGKLICPTCVTLLGVGPKKRSRKTSKVKGFRSSSILNRLDDISNFQTSTKIEALKEEIRNMLEDDGSAKGIVFSQFVSFLDLIGYSLTMAGVKWVQLNGSMNMEERSKAIIAFTDDANCKILLMSLKAGGVALNLVVASHVFLMDPWWNPAAEKQAQDRIHRIGQRKPIRVFRLVIGNTIEERILALQRKKELIFEGTLGKSPDAMAKLTADDLMFLFST